MNNEIIRSKHKKNKDSKFNEFSRSVNEPSLAEGENIEESTNNNNEESSYMKTKNNFNNRNNNYNNNNTSNLNFNTITNTNLITNTDLLNCLTPSPNKKDSNKNKNKIINSINTNTNTNININTNSISNLIHNSQLEKKLKNSSFLKTTGITISDKEKDKDKNKQKHKDKDFSTTRANFNSSSPIKNENYNHNFSPLANTNEINKDLTNFNFKRSKKIALREIYDEINEKENNFYKSISNDFKVFDKIEKKKLFDYEEFYMKKSFCDKEEKKIIKEKMYDNIYNRKMNYEKILNENLKEMKKMYKSNKKTIEKNDQKFLKLYDTVKKIKNNL